MWYLRIYIMNSVCHGTYRKIFYVHNDVYNQYEILVLKSLNVILLFYNWIYSVGKIKMGRRFLNHLL